MKIQNNIAFTVYSDNGSSGMCLSKGDYSGFVSKLAYFHFQLHLYSDKKLIKYQDYCVKDKKNIDTADSSA